MKDVKKTHAMSDPAKPFKKAKKRVSFGPDVPAAEDGQPSRLAARLAEETDAAQRSNETQTTAAGFQPGENYQLSESSCSLSPERDTELCLIQLPMNWKSSSSGEMHLPWSEDSFGHCKLEDGTEFHVLEQPHSLASQIYAYLPGKTSQPQAIVRHLTLVRSEGLNLPEKAGTSPLKVKSESLKQTPGTTAEIKVVEKADQKRKEPEGVDRNSQKSEKKDKHKKKKHKREKKDL